MAGDDAGNNLVEETDARGHKTTYTVDGDTSRNEEVIDRLGNKTTYEYDNSGRTTKVTAPNGGTVSYNYNAYDDLTKIVRGNNQAYGMTYDAYRNLTQVGVGKELADGSLELQTLVSYDYKTGGNRLKSMTYANGAVQNLTYDRFGNVIGEKWTNGTTTEAHYRYFYDASNQLVKTLDISNKKMYNINRVGENVTSIEEYDVAIINTSTYAVSGLSLVGTMRYSFDSDGKQFRKKYVATDGSEQKYVFEYQDEQNVAVQLPTGVVSHAKSDHLGRKVFDELQLGKGLMNRKFNYHEGKITEAHEANDKEVSDPQTTLVKQIEFADGRTIQYKYDAEERITQVIDTIDGVETKTEYTYDALGQLLTEKKNNVTVNTMTYDNYGNIKTKNGKTYTYDSTWKDKLLSTGAGSIGNYDLNGNPQSYLGNTLVWEKGRQLKQYGANTYKYNNEGIRIRKQTSTEIHEYILDGTNIVKEIVTDICNCPKYTNEYLYDLDGTVCGLKYNGTAYYFYKNLQGDVIAITDNTGAVVARYTYDAWGKCTIVSDDSDVGIATINPFRYRSYYYDAETSLYYLQSRYYNPEVGRFINADDSLLLKIFTAKTQFFSNNLFVYCNNSPINNADYGGYVVISTIVLIVLMILFFLCFAVIFGAAGVYKAKNTEQYKNAVDGGKFMQAAIGAILSIIANCIMLFISLVSGTFTSNLASGITAVIISSIDGNDKSFDEYANIFTDAFSIESLLGPFMKLINNIKKIKGLKVWLEKLKEILAALLSYLINSNYCTSFLFKNNRGRMFRGRRISISKSLIIRGLASF